MRRRVHLALAYVFFLGGQPPRLPCSSLRWGGGGLPAFFLGSSVEGGMGVAPEKSRPPWCRFARAYVCVFIPRVMAFFCDFV
jgi:hypothetical protein